MNTTQGHQKGWKYTTVQPVSHGSEAPAIGRAVEAGWSKKSCDRVNRRVAEFELNLVALSCPIRLRRRHQSDTKSTQACLHQASLTFFSGNVLNRSLRRVKKEGGGLREVRERIRWEIEMQD